MQEARDEDAQARRRPLKAAWRLVSLALVAIILAGCVDAPARPEGDGSESAPARSVSEAAVLNWTTCSYQEALLVIDAIDAAELLPPGYVPVNALTGDDETAILFIPYTGCGDVEWVLVGITVQAPADSPGESNLAGYLLGTYVDGWSDPLRAAIPGPFENATITQEAMGAISTLTVGNALGMTAAHFGRNEITSENPFSIRLFREDDGVRSVSLLKAVDLERENTAGAYEGTALFGHDVPPGAPISFVGTIHDLHLEKLE